MSVRCWMFLAFMEFATASNNETSSRVYKGVLTPSCIINYHRIFVSREVSPRNYHYFHEDVNNNIQRNSVQIQFRIVGGKITPIQEVPYQVLYGPYCGGTLIAPEWVITAAHCKEKENIIYAGATQRSRTKAYNICAHFTHPRWNSLQNTYHQDFDYQLLLLEQQVPVTPYSRPIAIGSVDFAVEGAMVSISGWGYLKYKQGTMQEFLSRIYVPILNANVCSHLPLEIYHNLSPRMFCAGMLDGSKDSCQGDSGGPVVVDNKLVGLVSFGAGCAVPLQPGVYTSIPMARDWIRAVTGLPI